MSHHHPDSPAPETAPTPLTETAETGWRALFSRQYRSAVLVMASGVALYAMNLYFTAALMPSVVADIGGERYYAWASTSYLITAVIATMFVSRLIGTRGARRSYIGAYVAFAAGTALGSLSPTMELFIAGRALQGIGAGLLTGLGYATIRSVLPAQLWIRATSLITAMFGVGALVGPMLGGSFAQAGAWRAAFGVLAVLALALAVVAFKTLPQKRPDAQAAAPIPIASMTALALTAAALSLSSILSGAFVLVMIGAGLLLLAAFLVIDSKDQHGVLPRLAYQRGSSLKWIYLTVATLCAGVMTENFIPLFGQQLGGLSPLVAGMLGATLSIGWVGGQLFSANVSAEAARALVRTGPALLTAGLTGYGLLLVAGASTITVIVWAALLLVAGAGIGLAFPHLTVAAMSSSDDPGESAKAAAAVSTTQLIAFTLTSALAGNLLLLGGADHAASARWLVLGIAVLTALGIGTAFAVTKKRPHHARP